ncbi:hypothetical protein EXE43_21435 [Halorubrum sp. SS5]|nr:hypothetical protein EXE43_21435 [Halorubrum sp. SS5]
MVADETVEAIFDCDDIRAIVEIVAEKGLSQADMDEVANEVFRRAISNFEPPDDYTSENYFSHPLVQMAVKKETTELHSYLSTTNYDHLSSLSERYERGLRAYMDEEPELAIFVFLSVQDGMMTWLCRHLDADTDEDGYYSIDRKKSILAEEYRTEVVDGNRINPPFDTGDVIENLDSIYDHRNEIMHGGANATFDMNIASVCALLIIATFEVIFEYRDIEPVRLPKEMIIPDF